MAHFAEINENNIVLRVIVVSNEDIMENGKENELKGINFCKLLLGENTRWVQTSYNGNFRKNFASTGYIYDEKRDAFIPPKIYNSWLLNEEKCSWVPPISYPNDNNLYVWNELIKNWDRVSSSQ